MPKLFIAGIVLFLLLGVGYGPAQAARYIPWDCTDWQAFAHADRDTAILESLAENRGKTLYCGIDQSDTFAKAETWAAGKDRNERDGTVYWGESGSFRGFIAAQEGWLTDGESGITGQSIAVIFEFPKTGSSGRRTKRFSVGTDAEQFPVNSQDSCWSVLGLICSELGDSDTQGTMAAAQTGARTNVVGVGLGNTGRRVDWETGVITRTSDGSVARAPRITAADWLALAKTSALRVCRDRGAQRAVNIAFGPGHDGNQPSSGVNHLGPGLGLFLTDDLDSGGDYEYRARQSRTWSATCIKKGPRR